MELCNDGHKKDDSHGWHELRKIDPSQHFGSLTAICLFGEAPSRSQRCISIVRHPFGGAFGPSKHDEALKSHKASPTVDDGFSIYQGWLLITGRDSGFWAAFGQIATAIIALVSIPAILSQMKSARSTSEVQTLIEFHRRVDALEDKLASSTNEDRYFAFIDYVNFLEVFAGLNNSKALHKISTEIIAKKIISALAIIDISDNFKEMLHNAIDTPSTFSEIKKFMKINKRSIDEEIIIRKTTLATK